VGGIGQVGPSAAGVRGGDHSGLLLEQVGRHRFPFGDGVGSVAGDVDDLVEPQARVAEVGADDVQ
jgi:hypothetical protein